MFEGGEVAIDGSKFKAVNNRDKNSRSARSRHVSSKPRTALVDRLQKVPDQQISETVPDARSLATSGRGTGMVGFNVQTAVDTKTISWSPMK
jgi:hypothetical protein